MARVQTLTLCLVLVTCCSGRAGPGTDGDAEADHGPDAASDTTTPDTPSDAPGPDAAPDVEPDSITPPGSECPSPVELVDTSSPDAVVGTGTPASCTGSALEDAIETGGIITFDCGADPHTITVTSEKEIASDTVLDGEGTITLSGGGSVRILAVHSSFERETPSLTVQRLAFSDGVRTGSGEGTDNGGGAIYRLGGTLTVIDCTFTGNRCPPEGQDVAGGAVYSIGAGSTTIVGSVFASNSCSNGGAIGNLHNDLTLVNSSVTGNSATGHGGNPGNGGNGGGIYMDGVGQSLVICGTTISGNAGNAYGGGLFRVSNDGSGATEIDPITVDANTIPDHDPSMAGGLYLQGMAIELTNTTISNNESRSAAGLFVGPNSTANLTNVTIAHNTALSGLAGGVFFSDPVSGTLLNCTLAHNRAPGEVAFAAATVGGSAVTLTNTLFAGHEVGNGWNPITCRNTFIEGGGNAQHPVERSGGGSDDPDALCSPDVLVADPLLGPLEDNGGPTLTLMPSSGSPALGLGTGCPETDQRGVARADPCTSGAVEAD